MGVTHATTITLMPLVAYFAYIANIAFLLSLLLLWVFIYIYIQSLWYDNGTKLLIKKKTMERSQVASQIMGVFSLFWG